MTVAELRAMLDGLPDDMPVEVYNGNMDSFMEYHCELQQGWEGCNGQDIFMFWAD
jgi:hypothetical protein